MVKGKIAGTLMVLALGSIPAPVYASHGEPMYYIAYHTDPTFTVQVGEDWGGCSNQGVTYTLTGQRTQYATYVHLANCVNEGGFTYLESI